MRDDRTPGSGPERLEPGGLRGEHRADAGRHVPRRHAHGDDVHLHHLAGQARHLVVFLVPVRDAQGRDVVALVVVVARRALPREVRAERPVRVDDGRQLVLRRTVAPVELVVQRVSLARGRQVVRDVLVGVGARAEVEVHRQREAHHAVDVLDELRDDSGDEPSPVLLLQRRRRLQPEGRTVVGRVLRRRPDVGARGIGHGWRVDATGVRRRASRAGECRDTGDGWKRVLERAGRHQRPPNRFKHQSQRPPA